MRRPRYIADRRHRHAHDIQDDPKPPFEVSLGMIITGVLVISVICLMVGIVIAPVSVSDKFLLTGGLLIFVGVILGMIYAESY